MRRRVVLNFVAQLLFAGFTTPATAGDVVIKMGTIAPDGSPWHQILLEMGEKWRKISGGHVKLVIYAGTLGDEPNLVDKLRVGQLQAVALSAGLSEIEPAVNCLEIPMMFQSYEELDYVRDRITPRLEKMIDQKGYVVLNWGDVGWVHFFSKTPVTRAEDLRKLKLFTWAGDDQVFQIWKANGFKPVALAATDILPGLQTGLIEAVPSAPLYALFDQFFGLAKNMSDVKWAPLVGATIVSKATWNLIPAAEREAMLAAARESGSALRGGIRKMGDDAVVAMQRRGLVVVHADDAALADWRGQVEAAYPKLRGRMAPAEFFDEVRAMRDEYRNHASSRGRP